MLVHIMLLSGVIFSYVKSLAFCFVIILDFCFCMENIALTAVRACELLVFLHNSSVFLSETGLQLIG